jgi:ribosomal protein S18 acetylase RimI-like enzyme
MGSELDTALSFLADLDDAVAGEVVPLGWGTGVFDPQRPRVWDANYVRVAPDEALEASEIAERAEPLFAERGLRHRAVTVTDPGDGQRLAPAFKVMGWESAAWVVMALRHQPAPADQRVTEVSDAAFRDARRAFELAEPPESGDREGVPELADQLNSRDELIRTAASGRCLGVVAGGQVVAFCALYSRDGIGQIELVSTRPEHRNRGYGRALVLTAAAASLDRGNSLTFLLALADDWPRQLYSRLGFDVVGTLSRFVGPSGPG